MVKWGGRKSRKSVIRFSREVFCSTKRGDLINRGADYEESKVTVIDIYEKGIGLEPFATVWFDEDHQEVRH